MKKLLIGIVLFTAAAVLFAQTNEMIRIQGGTFTMGSNDQLDWGAQPQRQVTVSSFYMSKYEITQKEYEEIMGNNPSHFRGPNLPVENVTWFQAIEYCNRRSHREGLTLAYRIDGQNVTWNRDATGYRLPTEAEWEYAARAGTRTPFNTGNTINMEHANFDGRNIGEEIVTENEFGVVTRTFVPRGQFINRTAPVGSYPANAFGLHDMHGNVWEWVWDWDGTYPNRAETNPIGASSGTYRVFRGGSWFRSAEGLRSALRNWRVPSFRDYRLGFRVVRNAQ